MFSLQQIIGKDDKFFRLMEGSAEEARASIQALGRLLNHPEKPDALEAFAEIRRKDKRITQELSEHLCKTFVTPLEREDIEALSSALYKIPKTAEKLGERLLLAPQHVKDWDVSKQMAMLERAGETLVLLVKRIVVPGKRSERLCAPLMIQNSLSPVVKSRISSFSGRMMSVEKRSLALTGTISLCAYFTTRAVSGATRSGI